MLSWMKMIKINRYSLQCMVFMRWSEYVAIVMDSHISWYQCGFSVFGNEMISERWNLCSDYWSVSSSIVQMKMVRRKRYTYMMTCRRSRKTENRKKEFFSHIFWPMDKKGGKRKEKNIGNRSKVLSGIYCCQMNSFKERSVYFQCILLIIIDHLSIDENDQIIFFRSYFPLEISHSFSLCSLF